MQLTYPGVYVTEIPSSVRPIAAVSTSIGAFIDFFTEGPVGKAVQIFGMADFDRLYGGLNAKSDASYQIAQFFLNGGTSAWVVRATGKPGTTDEAKTAAVTISTKTSAGAEALVLTARNAGAWGKRLRAIVEPALKADGSYDDQKFNLYVSRYAVEKDRRPPLVTEKFLNVAFDKTDPRWVVAVVNAGSQLVMARAPTNGTLLPAVNGTLGEPITTNSFAADFHDKTFNVQITGIASQGPSKQCTISYTASGNDLRALRASVENAIRAQGADDPGLAAATVALVGNRLLIKAGPSKTYEPKQKISITVAPPALGFATASTNRHEYEVGFVGTLAQTGHEDGVDGEPPGVLELKAALAALDPVDLFNLLCMPRVVASDISGAGFDSVVSDAIAYCEKRRAFFIIDIPEDVRTPQAVQDWIDLHASSVRHKNAAFYFPRVLIADPKAELRLRSIGASGTMAGIYSRTDTERGVWKAPAGVDAVLRGVSALDYQVTDPENGVLNPLGIDCLRTFPVYGQVAWGARTGVGADAMASEWKYIPIRRLALMIEESLFRGTKWVVFEPNDEPLWAKIRQNVGAFMMGLFRQGAFQGSTPDKAFFVKCDGETTTAIDRNNGVVNIEVGFAPLKPAEFVVLKIQQIPDVK
ncbi:MAG: phage tail sheath family protein [Kofleriaceae bacterium]